MFKSLGVIIILNVRQRIFKLRFVVHQVYQSYSKNTFQLLKLLNTYIGCGKTQLSMQLCSQAFFSNKNSLDLPVSVIYIDTENNISARRCKKDLTFNIFHKKFIIIDFQINRNCKK